MEMGKNPLLISNLEVADLKCETLLSETFIGLDCEGVDLGREGKLCLITVIRKDSQVYIFDVFTCPAILEKGKLKTVLESPNITKIIHDCRADRANLLAEYSISLGPVFDTQIAYKVTHPQDSFRRIGWNVLCRKYRVKLNELKGAFHAKLNQDERFWTTRPLSEEMIKYVAGDVVQLPGLYHRLNSEINKSQRDQFVTLCANATAD